MTGAATQTVCNALLSSYIVSYNQFARHGGELLQDLTMCSLCAFDSKTGVPSCRCAAKVFAGRDCCRQYTVGIKNSGCSRLLLLHFCHRILAEAGRPVTF